MIIAAFALVNILDTASGDMRKFRPVRKTARLGNECRSWHELSFGFTMKQNVDFYSILFGNRIPGEEQ